MYGAEKSLGRLIRNDAIMSHAVLVNLSSSISNSPLHPAPSPMKENTYLSVLVKDVSEEAECIWEPL